VYAVVAMKLIAELFVDLAQEARLNEGEWSRLDAFFALML